VASGARPITAAWRAVGWAAERHLTNDQRGLHHATWSARQASRMLLGLWVTLPPEALLVLGADAIVERRSGGRITAKGGDRDAVRSTKPHVMHGVGLNGVAMMGWRPAPWSQRVWALPWLTAWC
jgi:hypothetical protein